MLSVADTFSLNGATYTVVDRSLLNTMRDNYSDLSKVCVSLVIDMADVFRHNSSFNQDIGNWDVSNVTNMRGMFYCDRGFNQDIGAWDVSNVTDMSGMFDDARSFNQDIGNWDESNVTNMEFMFRSASDFNQDIGNWDVTKVTDMKYIYFGSTSFNQDLTYWCVLNIPSQPSGFSSNSALTQSNHPVWGTCPKISVSENEIGSELNAFPNPVQDILYVQAPKNSSLLLMDMNGKTLTQLTTDSVKTSIDMSSYAQGVYMLQIQTGETVETRRIVRK